MLLALFGQGARFRSEADFYRHGGAVLDRFA